jgi:choline dehydrogenase
MYLPRYCICRANPLVNWNYDANIGKPLIALAARSGVGRPRTAGPAGRSGGRINSMLHVRGNPADDDGWAQRGCRSWSYADVPFFKKSERYASGDPECRRQAARCSSRITALSCH